MLKFFLEQNFIIESFSVTRDDDIKIGGIRLPPSSKFEAIISSNKKIDYAPTETWFNNKIDKLVLESERKQKFIMYGVIITQYESFTTGGRSKASIICDFWDIAEISNLEKFEAFYNLET